MFGFKLPHEIANFSTDEFIAKRELFEARIADLAQAKKSIIASMEDLICRMEKNSGSSEGLLVTARASALTTALDILDAEIVKTEKDIVLVRGAIAMRQTQETLTQLSSKAALLDEAIAAD